MPVNYQTAESIILTRMHSSRMRTLRCSGHPGGVYPSMHWGVCIPACTGQGCVYPSMHWAEGGCIPAHTGQGDVCPGVCVCPGGCLPGGVSAQWGVCHIPL